MVVQVMFHFTDGRVDIGDGVLHIVGKQCFQKLKYDIFVYAEIMFFNGNFFNKVVDVVQGIIACILIT